MLHYSRSPSGEFRASVAMSNAAIRIKAGGGFLIVFREADD
jgi:hypothetical protein